MPTSDDLVISTDRSKLDMDQVIEWLDGSYWGGGRPRAQVVAGIDGSRAYGAYRNDVIVGFARAVTDGATFAWVADVYVAESERGKSVGRTLVKQIVDDLEAEGVYRFMLTTRDAHGVYSQVGFTPLAKPDTMMERKTLPPGASADAP